MPWGLARRFWLMLSLTLVVTIAAIALPRLYAGARLGTGYMAQTLCAGIFVSHRNPNDVMAQDLSQPGSGLMRLFQPRVDPDSKTAKASFHGIAEQTSIYRDGLGCTLLNGADEVALRAQANRPLLLNEPRNSDAEWPEGERVLVRPLPDEVDREAVQKAIDAVLIGSDSDHPRRTRAVVVVHDGRIVAERYAPGFDAQTPLIGWSMTKTVTNALVGIRVGDGKLALDDEALLPEWRADDDPRRKITLDHLLRMTSGLAFVEKYDGKFSDVAQMLFVHGDAAGFAAAKPLAYEPGKHWSYSSGNTNIIASVLRQTFETEEDYLRFPFERLFGPLGMRSAVFEPDAAGTLLGSSFLYATARDWARLGLLYLRDGVWLGERLLPANWVRYTLEPTKQSPDERYGAHIWLKLPKSPGLGEPPLPEPAYYMLGYDGQVVTIVPSHDLVIVRLGQMPDGGLWENAWDLARLVNAFPVRDAQ